MRDTDVGPTRQDEFRQGTQVRGARADVDVQAVVVAVDLDDLGTQPAQRIRAGDRGGTMAAVQRDLQTAQIHVDRVHAVFDVAPNRVFHVAGNAHARADRALPVPLDLGERLDLVLEVVGQLETVSAEELDPVVLRCVMRRRDDHPPIGAQLTHEVRYGRRRDDPGQQRVGATGADARDERGLQQVAASARVTADDDASAPLVAEEVPRGLAEFECEFGRELGVGDPTHAVGSEKSNHRVTP